ncbi:MAG: carbohydrate-binding domain-containing protein [Clostridia bacterium]|nr:carbohydrate-binding domain-containing protein [Clostridia bacterium]
MKCIRILAAMLCTFLLCSCAQSSPGEKINIGEISKETDAEETVSTVNVVFSANSAIMDGDGASFSDSVFTVTKGGSYSLSGELNGCIVVDVPKKEKVELILCGLTVESNTTSAVYVKSVDKITFYLEKDTVNTLTDGDSYCIDDSAVPSACIYSADDVEICGEGQLLVYAKCRNGIQTKNDLRIKGGNITVTAPKNALKGKDNVVITAGNVKITGAKDGIKSDNEAESGRGNVTITGGNVDIYCQDDGIQAYRSITINGEATVKIEAGDRSLNCDGTVSVVKGCLVEK